jgi:hypothetical protein
MSDKAFFASYYGKNKGHRRLILESIVKKNYGWNNTEVYLNGLNAFDNKKDSFVLDSFVYIDKLSKLPYSPIGCVLYLEWRRTAGNGNKYVTFMDFEELTKECEIRKKKAEELSNKIVSNFKGCVVNEFKHKC